MMRSEGRRIRREYDGIVMRSRLTCGERVTNYKAYLCFVSCLMALLSTGDGDKYLDTARETLDGLATRFGSQERAPLLAQLELNRRLRERSGESVSGEHSDVVFLSAYWTQFGHKGSVLDDLKPYVDGQSGLVAVMRDAVKGEAVSAAATGNGLRF
jgi:hypothetical protein